MSSKQYLTNQRFFKPTYNKALEVLTPEFLIEDDINTFGKDVDIADQIINSHLEFCSDISSILSISSIDGTLYGSMSSIEGIAPYFIKQNNLTNITTDSFQTRILKRFDKSFKDFDTSSSFKDYLDSTLLPAIKLNQPSSTFALDLDPSAAHIFLIENLSWLYFLNTSGESYSPSAGVSELIAKNLFLGYSIQLNDCLKLLSEHLWKNGFTSYYPSSLFSSGTGTFTSGTQQLDNLKTWIDIVYSPLYRDSSNFIVRDRFDSFIYDSVKTEDKIPNGPYSKFLRAISFLSFDIDDDTQRLESLYNIEECPDEFLPYLADIIGWDLFGSNPERWRLQLKNAVEVYKKVGTKKSIQFALNTIFPKDIFSIESRITELWESYIPYLIYYSLATESSYFKSYDSWNSELANQMGVSGYSSSSLDDNLKLTTDRIIYEVYQKFASRFNIPNKKNGFHYRNRNYPIPPFEEYPYYVNIELTGDMIDFIADRLVCFGVRQEFALQARDYIIQNTLDVDDEPRSSSWLFFTSGYNEPPNLDRLITNLNDEKFEYASLWSGKSSHFKLVFDASEFDFTKQNTDDIDSGDAVILASKITNAFAPAHAIPLISLTLSSQDYTNFESSALPLILPNQVDDLPGLARNTTVSGLGFNTYMRDVREDGDILGRNDVSSIAAERYLSASELNGLERNTRRRKSYEVIMPFNGYYDRTGFNMPVSFHMDSGLSGIPLGFIPSSLSFADVDDYLRPGGVYSKCEGVNSNSSYYGYDVSNTLKCRGHLELGVTDAYNTRGQLPEIYATMHEIKEAEKVILASAALGELNDQILGFSSAYQSYANSATQSSGWFPEATSDYYNFSFGRDFHTYYGYYTDEFKRHALAEHLHELDGPNIFSHTFGPILYNHDFSILGEYAELHNAVVSSLSTQRVMPWYDIAFTGAGSFEETSAYVDEPERVTSGIVNAVELIQTSGSPFPNLFSILKIDSSFKKTFDDPYMFDRTFIVQQSVQKIPRIRFKVSSYQSQGIRPIADNFLIPDHKHKASAKLTVADGTGRSIGGRQVGIWIHTEPEDGMIWSYDNQGNWTRHDQAITKDYLLEDLATIFSLENSMSNLFTETNGQTRFQCIEIAQNRSLSSSPIANLTEEDFWNLEVEFDTCNRKILLPESYLSQFGQLHRLDQKYVVEVFLVPSLVYPENLMVLDTVSIQDTSLKRLSEISVIDGCPEVRVPLMKEQIQSIFRFWNTISGKNYLAGIASRDTAQTESIMGANGGSKVDYREKLGWSIPVLNSADGMNLVLVNITV